MTHGHEKSDSAIVAVKPANKAVQPAAELVEPRAGTKGNAEQQSTYRTQSRESVSQALDRIRKVAKERKKEKFTALFHHINIDLLEEAVYELKENAAPGVDRLTWKDYEAAFERNIGDLNNRVQRGVSGIAVPARIYSQARRSAAPARGRSLGGQDSPTGGGRAAEHDLRGGLPRVLVWISAWARCARRAGCALRRDPRQEGELHPGRRHPVVL